MRSKRKNVSAMMLNGIQIPISNSIYTIKVEEDLAEGTGHAGECHFEDHVIKLVAGLTGRYLFKVLCHEIRHAHHGETGLLEILQNQAWEMDCQSFASLMGGILPILSKFEGVISPQSGKASRKSRRP